NVTFCAGPRVNSTVSGDWDIPLGSIIIPLHVNCRASSANTAMLVKPKISANMLVRNIDPAPNQTRSQAWCKPEWAKRHILSACHQHADAPHVLRPLLRMCRERPPPSSDMNARRFIRSLSSYEHGEDKRRIHAAGNQFILSRSQWRIITAEMIADGL